MTSHEPTPDIACPVALLGEDYPGLRPRLAVAEGDLVATGQAVFVDARRPAIAFASPITGRVASVRFGPRRTLSALVLEPQASGPPPPSDRLPEDGDLRGYLLARGQWPAFVARPFGGPPDPDARADAIVVSAVPASPESFDPYEVLFRRKAELARGLEALTALTDGTVHLCTDAGSLVPVPNHARIRVHARRAARDWRTASGQVARVHPVGSRGQVWTIGFQDVIALGHLLITGLYDPVRHITLRQRDTHPARLLHVPLGAHLRDILGDGSTPQRGAQLVSGTAEQGRAGAYLGRHHDEIGISPRLPRAHTAVPYPLIPFAALNRMLPARVPAVPLMRALSIGDAATCERLGCLELLEDDMAPLTALCVSGTDYGRCLRDVLDQLRKAAA